MLISSGRLSIFFSGSIFLLSFPFLKKEKRNNKKVSPFSFHHQKLLICNSSSSICVVQQVVVNFTYVALSLVQSDSAENGGKNKDRYQAV